jgi:hypothetical protein
MSTEKFLQDVPVDDLGPFIATEIGKFVHLQKPNVLPLLGADTAALTAAVEKAAKLAAQHTVMQVLRGTVADVIAAPPGGMRVWIMEGVTQVHPVIQKGLSDRTVDSQDFFIVTGRPELSVGSPLFARRDPVRVIDLPAPTVKPSVARPRPGR